MTSSHRSSSSPPALVLPSLEFPSVLLAPDSPPERSSSPSVHPSLPATPRRTNVLKRNLDDVGWEYGVLVEASKDKVKCKLCDKVMHGGIYRLKQHLAHVEKNTTKCMTRTPQALDGAKRKREEKTVREIELREEVNVSRVGELEEVTCVGSSEPHKLGPIDK